MTTVAPAVLYVGVDPPFTLIVTVPLPAVMSIAALSLASAPYPVNVRRLKTNKGTLASKFKS